MILSILKEASLVVKSSRCCNRKQYDKLSDLRNVSFWWLFLFSLRVTFQSEVDSLTKAQAVLMDHLNSDLFATLSEQCGFGLLTLVWNFSLQVYIIMPHCKNLVKT